MYKLFIHLLHFSIFQVWRFHVPLKLHYMWTVELCSFGYDILIGCFPSMVTKKHSKRSGLTSGFYGSLCCIFWNFRNFSVIFWLIPDLSEGEKSLKRVKEWRLSRINVKIIHNSGEILQLIRLLKQLPCPKLWPRFTSDCWNNFPVPSYDLDLHQIVETTSLSQAMT